MSESLRATRGRSARTVIAAWGSVEKVRVNVKGGLFKSEKVEGAESVAVILGGAEDMVDHASIKEADVYRCSDSSLPLSP